MVWPLVSGTLRHCAGPQLQVLRYGVRTVASRDVGYEEISLDKFYRQVFHTVEKKWQTRWAAEREAMLKEKRPAKPHTSAKKKSYILAMFPYPSGRLHLGHVRVYAISHTLAAYKRLRGHDVIHPMGWDSFGLPAENAAIDRGIAPHEWTERNIEDMKEQLDKVGLHFNWERELATHRPEYYKWTQWLFLRLHEHGLAYQTKAFVNWDPVDQTVLANEQVDGEGRAWRSGAMAERRELRQWFLKISDYSQELYKGLGQLDWPANVRKMQKEWIGPSKGIVLKFRLEESAGDVDSVDIYTTMLRDVFGTSFVAVSRSHPLVRDHLHSLPEKNREKVREFCSALNSQPSEGIDTGLTAINPYTGHRLPVYVAGYVHEGYATEAIMGVPSQNNADNAFAEQYGVPVVVGEEDGKLVNAGEFTGLEFDSKDTNKALGRHAAGNGFGSPAAFSRLRDWLISRQRYWGTPIPMVHCSSCPEPVPVPDDHLPVVLPPDVQLEGRGGSPLSKLDDWVNVPCPKCGSPARRDTDTMDTFMDSSWYFLRFADPHNDKELILKESAMAPGTQSFLPVDTYIGGVEHAILHLLYARFIHRFANKIGLVESKEPFKQLVAQGIVKGKTYTSAETGHYLKPEELQFEDDVAIEKATGKQAIQDWDKMSKSKHNGVDPLEVMARYGADATRMYLLGNTDMLQPFKWDDGNIIFGFAKLVSRVWQLGQLYSDGQKAAAASGDHSSGDESRLSADDMKRVVELEETMRGSVEFVADSFDKLRTPAAIKKIFKTVDELMVAVAHPQVCTTATFRRSLDALVVMLYPLAPHLTEEVWQAIQRVDGVTTPSRVYEQPWPTVDDFKQHGSEVWQVRVIDKANKAYPVFQAEVPLHLVSDVDAVAQLAMATAEGQRLLAGRPVTSWTSGGKKLLRLTLEGGGTSAAGGASAGGSGLGSDVTSS